MLKINSMYLVQGLKTLGLALIMAVSEPVLAAEISPESLTQDKIQSGNYLGALQDLLQHEIEYKSSEYRENYFELLSYYYSFLGQHQEALKAGDALEMNKKQARDLALLQNYNQYKMKTATEVILELADQHQVLFINEIHHIPEHRAYTLSLLHELYQKGFRYFAAESLDTKGLQSLKQHGYLLQDKQQYYSNEPSYGELIREAKRIGYEILAFDAQISCDKALFGSQYCDNLIEEAAAKHLFEQVFKNHPSAKLLVHAGAEHTAKRASEHFIPMAVHFEQISGIKPFSIDQTKMRERSRPKYEDLVYRVISNSGLLKDNMVFVDEENQTWLPKEYQGSYDLMVFKPRTQYRNQRPLWLFNEAKRQNIPISKQRCQNQYPCVLEAFFNEEGIDGVPVDRIVVNAEQKKATMALSPGHYTIRALDQDGKILSISSEQVQRQKE